MSRKELLGVSADGPMVHVKGAAMVLDHVLALSVEKAARVEAGQGGASVFKHRIWIGSHLGPDGGDGGARGGFYLLPLFGGQVKLGRTENLCTLFGVMNSKDGNSRDDLLGQPAQRDLHCGAANRISDGVHLFHDGEITDGGGVPECFASGIDVFGKAVACRCVRVASAIIFAGANATAERRPSAESDVLFLAHWQKFRLKRTLGECIFDLRGDER